MGELYKLLLSTFRLPPQKSEFVMPEQNILTTELPICLSLMNTVCSIASKARQWL